MVAYGLSEQLRRVGAGNHVMHGVLPPAAGFTDDGDDSTRHAAMIWLCYNMIPLAWVLTVCITSGILAVWDQTMLV